MPLSVVAAPLLGSAGTSSFWCEANPTVRVNWARVNSVFLVHMRIKAGRIFTDEQSSSDWRRSSDFCADRGRFHARPDAALRLGIDRGTDCPQGVHRKCR